MPASIIISCDAEIAGNPVILKIEYSCQASEQPQPCEYGECPSATSPYYNLHATNYSEAKKFYEKHKNLPFCRIVANKSMKHSKPECTAYWTEYDSLYNKRDGWLATPFLSPTFA